MKFLKETILVAAIGCWNFSANLNAQNTVYQNNLDDFETGTYDVRTAKQAFGVDFFKGADEGRVAVTSFPNKGKALRALYPKGKVKTNDSGFHTKLFWDNPNNEKQEELYFSYNIYIPADFEFRAGAKIPGLAYQTSDRNMSVRLMWRLDGRLEYYNHFNTRPTWEGWSASVDWSFTGPYTDLVDGEVQADQAKLIKGQWNHIELYNKLNTPGENDGIMRAWLNGNLALDITDNGDYRQRGEADIALNCIYLSTFFGGSDERFQPTKDQYAYFDDFIVSKTRIGFQGNRNDNPEIEEETPANVAPEVTITSPSQGAVFTVGEEIVLAANATDANGNLDKVNFKINNKFYKTDKSEPFTNVYVPSEPGDYIIGARAFDKDGLTKEVTVNITVQAADADNDANDDFNQGENEGNNSCGFDTPSSSALASFNRQSFNNIYVLGSGVPDASNIRRFRINWNAARNGLYQFAVNTANGVPSHYVNLLDSMTFDFNSANPELTLTNTGLAGWDGSYWVNNDGDNFVMVSKNGGFSIYFTNGAAPNCGSSAKSLLNDASEVSIKVYPNPATNFINVSGNAVSTTASVVDIQGRIVKSILLNAEVTTVDISELQRGMYFLNVHNIQKTITFIKK